MARLVAFYKTPKDKAAFDAYYTATHAPLARKIPGLRGYTVSDGPVTAVAGAQDVYKVAVLEFDSLAALQAGLATPDGQAAAGDIPNFATGGVDLVVFDSKPA
ncbi:EthD family reductase [Neomegalonema perideroedes]|uniref:EthD family reductase n=1 Tax=Neomegalonema perideroedes TaxID=217219 RepID=UPI0003650AB5|nr:EthD family reductase [Neomegalonema perideroedes]